MMIIIEIMMIITMIIIIIEIKLFQASAEIWGWSIDHHHEENMIMPIIMITIQIMMIMIQRLMIIDENLGREC